MKNKLLQIGFFAMFLPASAIAGAIQSVPEIDGGTAVLALGLLASGIALLREKMQR